MYQCILYLIITGIVSFLGGRVIPKTWFNGEKFPFRTYRFEKDGKLYKKIWIHKWQNHVPDMSRIFKKIMPAKKIEKDFKEKLPRMIQETCLAEFVHVLLCFSGLYCICLWKGIGGKTMAALNILGNIPFVLIQRYNRPRFIQLEKKMKEGRKNACTDIEL